jgi:tyrosine-protein kinase Etk/Wzc
MQENITTPPQAVDEEGIDFIEYLEIILRRKKMILKVTIISSILSVVTVLLLPKTYESTAMILPPQQEQGLMAMMMGQMAGGSSLAGLAGGLLGAATPADMYATVLASDDIKDAIINRFKLMEVYDKKERVAMYKQMEKIVEIKAGKKDGVISITVEDEEPKRAAAIAGAYVDELAKLVAEMGVTGAGVNRTFLEGRLAKAKADLARAEDNLKAFQLRRKAIDVPEQAKASIEGIAMLQAQLVVQETQLAAVRSRFTDTMPETMDLKATIINLKRQIAQMEGKGSGSSIIPTGSVPQIGQEYVRVMREFKIQETLVELLTKQYELAKLSEAKSVSNIQVIQKPHVPDKKVKPKRILIVLGVTILAFLSSISWAVIRDYLHNMPDNERQRWLRIRKAYAAEKE